MMKAYLLRMRSGREGGGKGPLVQTERSGTLATGNDQTLFVIAMAGNTIGRKPMNGGNGNGFETDGKMYTLTATDVHGVCYDCTHNYEAYENVGVSPTLQARMGTGGNQVPLTIFDSDRRHGNYKEMDCSPTLVAKMGTGGGNVPITFGKVCRPSGKDGLGEKLDEIKVASTRNCMDIGDAMSQEAVVMKSHVRRLTPTECERLMGFPDGYTNIKENCPDSPRYKALGNSWAVPVVRWIGLRIKNHLEREMK